MHKPLLSVITINYNNAAGLEATLKSVVPQTFTGFEWIIVDGGSTDSSLQVLKDYESKFAYWISEKDGGIYNAQNKGIAQATGQYLLFLNSGDCLADANVLQDLAAAAASGADILYGDIRFKSAHANSVYTCPDKLHFRFFLQHSLPHPSTLIRKALFDAHGFYNEQMKICSDWVFFLDMICKYDATYKHVNRVVSVFQTGGLSSDLALVELEKQTYLRQHYAAFYEEYLLLDRASEELEHLRERVGMFRDSRMMKLLFALIPGRYRQLLS